MLTIRAEKKGTVMKAYIEVNQKFGEGYQIRLVANEEDGLEADFEQVWDVRPYELFGAVRRAKKMVEVLDRRLGTTHDLRDVVEIDRDAVMENAKRDITSARAYNTMQDRELAFEAELFESVEKQVIYFYQMMRDDDDALRAVIRFCGYLADHGYHYSQEHTFAELSQLPQDRAEEWISDRFAKYVKNE